MTVGVVSGLPRETDCFQAIPEAERHFKTFAGVGPARAEEGARALIEHGAQGLMSFGVAGGLSADAPAGMVVLATKVVAGDTSFEASEPWRREIYALIGSSVPVAEAAIAGSDRMVGTPDDKRALHKGSGAIACDMESHAVARVAAELNVPFCVVRAISDPDDRVVPKWVLKCLTRSGDVRIGALAWQAARRPQAWGNLIRLAGDSRKAFDGLRGVAGGLGPRLGFQLGLGEA